MPGPAPTSATWVPETQGTATFQLSAGRFSVHHTRHPVGFALPRHEHERASLNVVLSGQYAETAGRATGEFGAGSLVYKPPGEPHSNSFDAASASCLLIELAEEEFEGMLDQKALPAGREQSNDPVFAGPIQGLLTEIAAPDDLTPIVVEGLVHHLLGGVEGASSRAGLTPGSAPPSWLENVRELVQDRFCESLGLSEVAREVGVHPSHVARVCQRHMGEPLGSYMRRVRVRRAAERLLMTELPIAEVALACGFADQSHLTRSFRSLIRSTPAAFRKTRRRADGPPMQFWF